MRTKPKQYAVALFEAVKGLSDDKARVVLANFVKILIKNNALRMSPQIMESFVKYANREEGTIEVKISTPNQIKEDMVEFFKKEAPNLLGKKSKKVNIKKEVVPDLLGGFVLECEDMVFDASIKNKLKLLKNSVISS